MFVQEPPQCDAIFVDLDGTICIHNMDPINVPDEIIPIMVEKLHNWYSQGSWLIVTTGRTRWGADQFRRQFPEIDKLIKMWITDLPVGRRVLINDVKEEDNYDQKAISVNVVRDKGKVMRYRDRIDIYDY